MPRRFNIDEDNDIVDNSEIRIYSKHIQKDWEDICALLNELNNKKIEEYERNINISNIIKRLYEEYSNYIDEYSLLKIDIIMDIADELGVDLE